MRIRLIAATVAALALPPAPPPWRPRSRPTTPPTRCSAGSSRTRSPAAARRREALLAATRRATCPASQFIQYQELIDGLKYMNTKARWQRYMEVWPLDGKIGRRLGQRTRGATPSRATTSASSSSTRSRSTSPAGMPTTDARPQEVGPDRGARHRRDACPTRARSATRSRCRSTAIERAGAEGGTRAMEDLVTAYTTGLAASRSSRRRRAPARRRSPTCCGRRSSTSPIRTPTAGGAARSPRAASSSSATTATAST